MKKITLSIAVLLGGLTAKAQTEYIDSTTKKPFGRSEMVLYSEGTNYNDLEYLYIGKFSKNWHWVEYTHADDIVVTMSDDANSYREICIQQGQDSLVCNVYSSFASVVEFKSKQTKFKIWISKKLK